jgi:hypothetical protein
MWQPLRDCAKQLTIHSKVRERRDNAYRVYDIIDVEFDQYHLQLLSEDDKPAEDLRQVLNGEQLLEYRFQVELKD